MALHQCGEILSYLVMFFFISTERVMMQKLIYTRYIPNELEYYNSLGI